MVSVGLPFAGKDDAIGETDPGGKVGGLGAVGEVKEDEVEMFAEFGEQRTGGAEIDVVALRSMSRAFADVYASHLQTEEEVLFPAAAQLKTPGQLQAMGNEMRLRRTTP